MTMTMEDKMKQILGEQSFIIAALQIQLEAVRNECEMLKVQLGGLAQGQMFSEQLVAPKAPKTNGEARPNV